MVEYYHSKIEFKLESGQVLPRLTLAYQTFGKLAPDGGNVIWIVHALTGDSDPVSWWPGIVGPGLVIDTEKYFVICANTIGSHYGSICPLTVNADTGLPYYQDFPEITNRDVVTAFHQLAEHLNISHIDTLIGPSLGGQQALEWAIMYPQFIKSLVLIATNAIHSPYGIAWNESQRMAIEVDPTWRSESPEAGLDGLMVARSIALISYRTKTGYDLNQPRKSIEKPQKYRAASYQRYQGEKLARRFNAYSYYLLTKMMDNHDIGRDRGQISEVLKTVAARTLIIGLDSDILFPIDEQIFLQNYIPNSSLVTMQSQYGHDGFLVEAVQMQEALSSFLEINSTEGAVARVF